MGLDNLFNRDDDHRKHKYYENSYNENSKALKDHDNHEYNDRLLKAGYHKNRHHNYDLFNLSQLMPILIANKKLIILVGGVFLGLLVLAIILALPLFGQLLDYINKIGGQGLIQRLLQLTGVIK
jgi:hypothetical protein